MVGFFLKYESKQAAGYDGKHYAFCVSASELRLTRTNAVLFRIPHVEVDRLKRSVQEFGNATNTCHDQVNQVFRNTLRVEIAEESYKNEAMIVGMTKQSCKASYSL